MIWNVNGKTIFSISGTGKGVKPLRLRLSKSTWAGLRTAYAAGCGLRELARNAAIPEATVLSRARREGWSAGLQRAKVLVPVNDPVVEPAEAVAQMFADDSRETRRSLSRYARRAAHAAAEHPEPLEIAQETRHVTAIASAVHGWEGSDKASNATVNVAVAILRNPDAFPPLK